MEALWQRFEKGATGSVYQRFDWCKTWFEVAATQSALEPLILVCSIEGRPTLLLPLYVSATRFGVRQAQFMGDKHSNIRIPLLTATACDRLEMIKAAKEGTLLSLIVDALREGAHADHLALSAMPEFLDGDANVLAFGKRSESAVALFSGALGPDFEALRAARRTSKAQRKARQKLTKLREIGEPELVLIEDPKALDDVLDVFFEQKGMRLHDAGVSSAFDNRTNRRFIRQLAHRSLATGDRTLELYALMLNDQVIAVAGAGRHRDRVSMAINSMTNDPALVPLSPGRLSIDLAVEGYCAEGVELFDLGLGENEYKRMWCDPVALFDVAVPLTTKGFLFGLFSSVQGAMLNHVRRSPRLLKLARSLKYQVETRLAEHQDAPDDAGR